MGIKERIYEIINRECKGSNTIFAERIDINVSTIQKWNDQHLPKGNILFRIYKEFNIDITWLLTGEGSPYSTEDTAIKQDGIIKITRDNKLIANISEDELAFIRTMRFCGDDYKHRVYIAATIRAQRMLEERRLETKEKLSAQKDLEILSLKAIE